MKDEGDLFPAPTVPVLVPLPVDGPYSYAVPEGMAVRPGSIVQVPLGSRQVAGVVWDADAGGSVDPKKLRAITRAFDCPPLTDEMRRFIDWVADYTLSPPGLVARMALRAPAAFDPEPWIEGLELGETRPDRMTEARRRVLETAEETSVWTKSGLAHASGVTASVVDGLVKAGTFRAVRFPPPPAVAEPDTAYGRAALSREQDDAASALATTGAEDGFSVTLLEGVTGSGKTEVYFEAVAAALDAGRQVLILLPEIALTQSFLDRFHARFGAPPAEWHSDVSPKMREKIWRQVAEGRVRVVAGARSALFLPFENLGLIIVDEEHDPAYKQEDRTFYHARDMAVVRGRVANFPVILASATPSVETRVNAAQGRYRHLLLSSRFSNAALPDLSLVDMRRVPPARGRFVSPLLLTAIRETIARGEQALLFLNRRGYAPLTLCRVCGHRFQCASCSTWLVDHRLRGILQCHHCGFQTPRPEACPECGTLDHLVACGPGVERIAEEMLTDLPEARTILLSSDLPGGARRLRRELDAIADGEADIVIGTQLVAKGHHFPMMTLVGAIDADLGLANGDPRAAERTFQLLHQVTGRAGRTGRASRGMIQTYQSDHPVMKAIASGDVEAFYSREICERERSQLPPFGRLAAIIVSANTRKEAETHAREIRKAAPDDPDLEVLGPAEAPLAVLRGRHRFRLLIQGSRRAPLQSYLRETLARAPKPRGSVQMQIDIDPQSFL
ncbi:primosomal protein N' [Fulvimarina sp. 2208YS6-2-32]|uniref:Replication restart protein PriA n=1 Tax=Fulvimarina uroteuthidis TaxID=3098149 RepID=A0ABU5HYH6_9HYPH|nr:primosomal protein N' [Fulvimarina sp. 2208YS6-2-32]MDY8107603.1 primosomal protein N' [Fulvimarina sp. 2208YS6-2-32]